jgi:hypothetical protein
LKIPNSITFLRRAQTNKNGSLDLENIIPGQYILVAIDHGWQINWGDPSTLRRYLMQGAPVELKLLEALTRPCPPSGEGPTVLDSKKVAIPRRDGRVVEGARLESVDTVRYRSDPCLPFEFSEKSVSLSE